MQVAYAYDVFLSHSSRDKAFARQLAEKLRARGLCVWFDEWAILPGQLIGLAIQKGLENSRVLVLAISKSAFESDWVTLESQAALFRDPTNHDRQFIPVRIDSFDVAQMPRMLRGFKFIDLTENGGHEKLAISCGAKALETSSGEKVATADYSQAPVTPMEFKSKPTTTTDPCWRAPQQMLRDRLSEQYEIGECIHFDDDELLFVARDRMLRRDIAIKVPKLPQYEADVVARRFQRKIQSISMVNHSHIIPVYVGFQIDQLPILVMGYVAGIDLGELIERTGAQPLQKIRKLVENVGDALRYSHRFRASHHRLTPQNILYDEDGNAMVTPMNFAPSNSGPTVGRNSTESDLRLSRYESPERFFRVPDELDKADQYSLGMIAYEMIVGKSVIDLESYESLRESKNTFLEPAHPHNFGRRNCPPKLWRIIKKLLAEKPSNRYHTFSSLVDDVRRISNADLGLERSKNTEMGRALRTVHESLKRCRLQPAFFRDLYHQLLKDESIQVIFTNRGVDVLDSGKQQWLLREGLDLLISYADEPSSPNLHVLTRVAQSHGHYRIRTRMYDEFRNALLHTVRRHDMQFQHIEEKEFEDIEPAWEHVLEPGLNYLKSQIPKGYARRLSAN